MKELAAWVLVLSGGINISMAIQLNSLFLGIMGLAISSVGVLAVFYD